MIKSFQEASHTNIFVIWFMKIYENQCVDFNNLEEQDNSNADEFFDVNMETGER